MKSPEERQLETALFGIIIGLAIVGAWFLFNALEFYFGK